MLGKFFKILASFVLIVSLFWSPGLVLAQSNSGIDPQRIIDLVNIERDKILFKSLRKNDALTKLAEARLEDMDRYKYFDHSNPLGQGLAYFAASSSYLYEVMGENLAINFLDNDRVMNAWMKSTDHMVNIMNSKYEDIGIAYREIRYRKKIRPVIVMILGKKKL